MKRRFFFWLLLASFLLQSAALAFPNEPEGFRGMRWGQSVAAVREAKGKYNVQFYSKVKHMDVYYIVPQDGERRLGGWYVDDLYAVFWNDQLIRVYAYFYGPGQQNVAKCYQDLKALAIDSFGPPSEEAVLSQTTVEARWLGEKAQIFLWHQDDTQMPKVPCVRISFQNSALIEQMRKAQKTVW